MRFDSNLCPGTAFQLVAVQRQSEEYGFGARQLSTEHWPRPKHNRWQPHPDRGPIGCGPSTGIGFGLATIHVRLFRPTRSRCQPNRYWSHNRTANLIVVVRPHQKYSNRRGQSPPEVIVSRRYWLRPRQQSYSTFNHRGQAPPEVIVNRIDILVAAQPAIVQ